jgi:hypothetical protein
MQLDIFSHQYALPIWGPVILRATRNKHKTFDCFKLHGKDQRGNEFEIRFFIDPGQAFEMATTFAVDHPDHPDNQLKEN